MVLVGIMMPVFSKAGLGQNGTKMVPLCPQSKIMAQVAFAAVQRAIKPRELGEGICGRNGGVRGGRGGVRSFGWTLFQGLVEGSLTSLERVTPGV